MRRVQKPEEDSTNSWVWPHGWQQAAQKARAKKFYHVDVCLAASAIAAKPSEASKAPNHVRNLEPLAKESTPNAAPAATSSGAGAWTWTPATSVDEATHEEDALRRESLADAPEKHATAAPAVMCSTEAAAKEEEEEAKSFAETPRKGGKGGKGEGGGLEKRKPDAWGELEAGVQPEGEPCSGGEIPAGTESVGWKIRKKFKGRGWLYGTVVAYSSKLEQYRVVYYKGHSENLVLKDLVKVKHSPTVGS